MTDDEMTAAEKMRQLRSVTLLIEVLAGLDRLSDEIDDAETPAEVIGVLTQRELAELDGGADE